MPCFCTPFLDGLAGTLAVPNPPIVLPPAALSALAAIAAELTATAAVSATASAALSASASAKIALMASAMASLKAVGVASLNASGAASLAVMIPSLNANLPKFAAAAAPVLPSVTAASLLASVVALAKKLLGIDLTAPGGVAQLQAKLAAMAQARAAASASATASASAGASAAAALAASASASASASAALSATAVIRAAAALGLTLTPPDPLSQLAAMAQAFLAAQIPPVTVPPLAMSGATGLLTGAMNIKAGFGINLFAAGSMTAVAAAVAKVDVKALASLTLSASATAAASATATASAAATAAASAQVDAALAPLSLPALTGVYSAANLAAMLKSLAAALPTTPCGACQFAKAAAVSPA